MTLRTDSPAPPDERLAWLDADVLVIGGGFGGTWAALRAAQRNARVILVEKAFVSRSGASTMSGGVTTCPLPDDDLDPWVEEFVTRGDYMCDQAWTRQLLEGQRERVAELAAWGVPISRDERGNIRRFASRGMVAVRCMQYDPKSAMEILRRKALEAGVQIVDRHFITELTSSDGRHPTRGCVTGAVGFDVRQGRRTVFRAKCTILATGMISLKGIHHVDNDTGDGVAMAWRVGARLADLEFTFGGTFVTLMKRYNLGSYNVAVAHGARLINRHGERFMARYDPVRCERSELSRVVAAFVKELKDGNGPVCLDLRHCDDSYWDDLARLAMTSGKTALLSGDLPDPRRHPIPIEATWGFWSGGRGGVEIDRQCRASVPGLYAVGANAKNPATGTHASAGAPTAFAMNSGVIAGEAAAREALGNELAEMPSGHAEALLRAAFEPLQRPPGGLSAPARPSEGGAIPPAGRMSRQRQEGTPMTPDALHDALAMLGGSVLEAMDLDAARLTALCERSARLQIQAEQARAAHLHDLVKLHEARNVCQNAWLIYSAALDRTESREQFYRTDYPDTDDENWFCSHALSRTDEGVRYERLPIPLDGPVQGRRSLPRRPSPIAAIFAGNYRPELYE